MRKLHVIDNYDRVGGEVYFRKSKFAHDPELLEAYECGKKDGWRCAMEELEEGGYAERRHYGHGSMPPMYREHDHVRMPEDDEVMYRRRRRANGEFY